MTFTQFDGPVSAWQGVPVNVAVGMGTQEWPWQPYSVAWGPILALQGSPCAARGYPHGTCIYMDALISPNQFAPADIAAQEALNGNPGAAQITADGVKSLNKLIYAVDTAGAVWIYNLNSSTWTLLPMPICDSTASLVAGQIAVANDTIFALTATNPDPGGYAGGAVFQYGANKCWTNISLFSLFLSIAPMNQSAFTDTNIYFWATDVFGDILYYTK
jgi:hypothetical protein